MSSLAPQPDGPAGAEAGKGDTARLDQAAGWLARLAPWLLIAGLVLFHAINNWAWLTENVTLTGWDRPRHLAHSLTYARMLDPLTLRSLFEVMVSDSIRPPLFPASASIMYWLFGPSPDIASMVNVFYMAIMLAATYGIGRRWGGRWQGLASAFLLAIFPMFYAMSRYFYLEFALTAMVTLTVFLLLASEGFQRRSMSLLFGLSLGLGLLTKRTFAVFLIGPVLVVVLVWGLLPALWQAVRQRPKLYWKRAALALAGGLVLAGLWYLPNRETVQTLILGDALFPMWWILAGLAIYFAILPSTQVSNALSAFFAAAALASTWYLARVEFIQRMFIYGYGVNDPRGRTLQLDRLTTYLYYVRKLGNEHLSLLILVLLVAVAIVAALVTLRRQGSLKRIVRGVRVEGWVVLAWIGGAYVLLTFSIYQETRAFTPVLPAVALVFGAALRTLPWRGVRWAALALVLVLGLAQFFALTYEPVQRRLPSTSFSLPIWGETSLLSQGIYIELPDEGPTDRGYWIQPDVLQRMEAHRQTLESDSMSLGLLARTRQVNAGAFIYLTLAEYPHLGVEALIDPLQGSLPEGRLLAHDYILVKGQNAGTNKAQEETIQAIIDGSSSLFDQAFELETTYALPDGDTAYLFRQRYHLSTDYPVEYVARLADDLAERTRTGDVVLLTPPALLAPFASHYASPAKVGPVPDTEAELASLVAPLERVFLVLGDAAAGDVQDWAHAWLNRNSFRADHQWIESLQVLTYGVGEVPLAMTPTNDLAVSLGHQIELLGYDLPSAAWQSGDVVPLTLFWRSRSAAAEDLNVFVHLLDPSGTLVAQADSAPVGGSRPTSSWQADEMIIDRQGLLLPETLSAGEYELLVGMYLPATGDRIKAEDADGQPAGDSISLGQIRVTSP